jgi:hypothetical protein
MANGHSAVVEDSPELAELCRRFLRQGMSFAGKCVKAAGLTGEAADNVEAAIITRCSEVISEAQMGRCPKVNAPKS